MRDGLQGGARVVVVNIQKFPSIKRLAESDPMLARLLLNKRVAFVIDEVHRTQNGTLHDATPMSSTNGAQSGRRAANAT